MYFYIFVYWQTEGGCFENIGECNGQVPEACGPFQITLSYYCDGKSVAVCDPSNPILVAGQ